MFAAELDTSIMDTYMREKRDAQLLALVKPTQSCDIWESWELGTKHVRLHFDHAGHLILTIR